jgi:ABC-type multidrug transport system fused ATPase/permease subunit
VNFIYVRWASKRTRDARNPDLWDMFSIMKVRSFFKHLERTYVLSQPELFLLVIGAAVTLFGSGFSLLQPILVSQLIQGMNTALVWWDLRSVMLKLIGTMLGEFVCNMIAEVITTVGMRRTLSHLRLRLFRGIIMQPFAKLESVDRGELQNRIMVDTTFVVSAKTTAQFRKLSFVIFRRSSFLLQS